MRMFLLYEKGQLARTELASNLGLLQCPLEGPGGYTGNSGYLRVLSSTKRQPNAMKSILITSVNKFRHSVIKDVRANCFCASLLRTQIHATLCMSACALSNKMNNDRKDGHCYSFA